MEHDRVLTFSPAHHPSPKVRRVGFELTDQYVEQCWSGVIRPRSTLLLRRMPVLWTERVPAEIPAGELGRSIGLGASTSKTGRLAVTLKRLADFHLIRGTGPSGDHFEMFVEVSPLTPRQLERLPEWTRATHERLFGAHLEGITRTDEHQARIATITARRPPPATCGTRTRPGDRPPACHRTMSLRRRPGCPGNPDAVAAPVGRERQVWRAHIDRFPSGEPVGHPGRRPA